MDSALIKAVSLVPALSILTGHAMAQEVAKKPVVIVDVKKLEDGTIFLNYRRAADGIHVNGSKAYPVSHRD